MCGRFDQHRDADYYARRLGLPAGPDGEMEPRYNVAPSQSPLVVRWSETGEPELVTLQWGLVPFWVKDPSKGPRPINARAETVDTKPYFRGAFARRRCLVPADGFYEWKRESGGKRPFYLRLKDGEPMFFAGIWTEREGQATFAIIVTAPNELAARVHDRMPAIIRPDDAPRWLQPQTATAELKGLLGPYPSGEMEAWQVSKAVNRPQNDGPELIEPVAE